MLVLRRESKAFHAFFTVRPEAIPGCENLDMVKRCSYGTCNSDTRYPERVKNVTFHPFPKPKTNLDRCIRWIKACGRPHHQLNVNKVTKDTYVCSKHFKDGYPSVENPDPMPPDKNIARKARATMKKTATKVRHRKILDWNPEELPFDKSGPLILPEDSADSQPLTEDKEKRDVLTVCPTLELLAAASEIQKLKDENEDLRKKLSEAIHERDKR